MGKRIKTHNVDEILLDYYMRKAELTTETLSKKIGMSPASYRNKRGGITEFSVEEMYKLIEVLQIPDNGDRDRIFNPQ